MFSIASAIAPIFILILVGFGFRQIGFPGNGFWQPAENLAYYILLPALIIGNLAIADLSELPVANIATTIVALGCSSTLVVFAIRPLIRMNGPAFTSVLQGSIRINAYIAFAVAKLLYGAEGIVLCALFVAVLMPVVNVICIGALAHYTRSGTTNWYKIPKQIVQNPIIVACAIGWALNYLPISTPEIVIQLLNILAQAALPLALLCVGSGLVLSLGKDRYLALTLACLLKLAIMPVIAALIMIFIGLSGLTFVIVMLFAACPASPASYILARQLGGDESLMAGILTAETLLSALAIPIVLSWVAESPFAIH